MNGSKNSDMKKRIIVIGGGAAGMQTALRLAEQGAEALAKAFLGSHYSASFLRISAARAL